MAILNKYEEEMKNKTNINLIFEGAPKLNFYGVLVNLTQMDVYKLIVNNNQAEFEKFSLNINFKKLVDFF